MTSTCHNACMHATQRCAWNSSSESRPLASHYERTLGKHHLTGIGVRGRDSYNKLIRASHTRKSEFALEFEPPPRAYKSGTTAAHRHTDIGYACHNGPRLSRPSELTVEVRPPSSIAYACMCRQALSGRGS